jgi:hypothetical protein
MLIRTQGVRMNSAITTKTLANAASAGIVANGEQTAASIHLTLCIYIKEDNRSIKNIEIHYLKQ